MSESVENEAVEKPEKPVEVAEVVSEPEPEPKVKKRTPKSEPSEGIPWSEDMEVQLSKLVFKSLYERNSRSVGLVQLRLVESGYPEAGGDKRGWLSEGTLQALSQFASDSKLGDHTPTSETVITKLFKSTPVRIVP